MTKLVERGEERERSGVENGRTEREKVKVRGGEVRERGRGRSERRGGQEGGGTELTRRAGRAALRIVMEGGRERRVEVRWWE